MGSHGESSAVMGSRRRPWGVMGSRESCRSRSEPFGAVRRHFRVISEPFQSHGESFRSRPEPWGCMGSRSRFRAVRSRSEPFGAMGSRGWGVMGSHGESCRSRSESWGVVGCRESWGVMSESFRAIASHVGAVGSHGESEVGAVGSHGESCRVSGVMGSRWVT